MHEVVQEADMPRAETVEATAGGATLLEAATPDFSTLEGEAHLVQAAMVPWPTVEGEAVEGEMEELEVPEVAALEEAAILVTSTPVLLQGCSFLRAAHHRPQVMRALSPRAKVQHKRVQCGN